MIARAGWELWYDANGMTRTSVDWQGLELERLRTGGAAAAQPPQASPALLKAETDYKANTNNFSLSVAFAQEAAGQGNRLLFTCRSLDYSASLSSPDLRVPQIEAQPMNAEQVHEFAPPNGIQPV